MEEENLTEVEYNQLISLIVVSNILLKKYKQLAELEITNKKHTDKFASEVEVLKSIISFQKELIKNINPNNLFEMIEEISKKIIHIEENFEYIDSISHNKLDAFALERVSSILKEYAITIIATPSNKEEYDENEEMDQELKYLQKIAESSKELLQNLENDKWLLLIHIIENKILNTSDERMRESLIKSKYYLTYLIKPLESKLIKTGFQVPENIIFSAELLTQMYPISRRVYETQKSSLGIDLYIEKINRLLKINNEEFSNNELEITIRECLLRTSFQFLTEEEIKILKIEFHIITENKNLIGFEKSIETIETAFKSYEQDKTLIKKVTLG